MRRRAGAGRPCPRSRSRRRAPRAGASPVAVPPSACRRSSVERDRVVVGRRRSAPLGRRRERDEADAQRARGPCRGSSRGAARRLQARSGCTSVGRHRARHVGDEHDRGLLDGDLRPCARGRARASAARRARQRRARAAGGDAAGRRGAATAASVATAGKRTA